ncbi:Cysteine desulfurase [Anaerohalosphaera lusitana]|uniref:Cysteine desulfurase n=1 Tax=Anaerohalosphaera lusitana TaxID=1936003 RepID=A0A1U9NQE5_9BACT|nr:cysteine desulfurase [Anaerohalosphaera lusitana]AQT70152.1 Cysteine desulfurase [Anaerohalosphaera lusitana]
MNQDFNIEKIRQDFPILSQQVYGKPLAYLDNAATTQKPRSVLDAITDYYTTTNSNIHRGTHALSEKASGAYETARKTVRHFLNADQPEEIIFTSGTTASINLVAGSFTDKFVSPGDEIIISQMEHHSNLVPWQILCKKTGAILKTIPLQDSSALSLNAIEELISDKTKLIAVTYVSNVLGTTNPIKRIVDLAHSHGKPVLVDAAQAVQHMPVDVHELDCDFLAFSGHKIYAGTGIGVLYAKSKWLESIPPWKGGGGMINSVSIRKTFYADPPLKFEAGTPNIAGAISLAAAIDYIQSIGIEKIAAHEAEVLNYMHDKLSSLPGLTIYGSKSNRHGAISFNLEDVDNYDAGLILDKMGVAVRTGTHCAEPLMQHYGITGTIRASIGMYNTKEEVDRLYEGLKKVQAMLQLT